MVASLRVSAAGRQRENASRLNLVHMVRDVSRDGRSHDNIPSKLVDVSCNFIAGLFVMCRDVSPRRATTCNDTA